MSSFKVDNAIIMAAGKSSRFAPLSYEKPKALAEVKGDLLIERQIKQLLAAGIDEIIVVTGYKSEDFKYLSDKYGVILLENPEYETRNNHSTLFVARKYLKNTYICSSDNYFEENPFEKTVEESYYSTIFQEGKTKEWCTEVDEFGYITNVTVGGSSCWILFGHAFFDENFSKKYVKILEAEYDHPKMKDKYWEDLYLEHMDVLKMKRREYPSGVIHEFDSLEELAQFDTSYQTDTRSTILKAIAKSLQVKESEIYSIQPLLNHLGNVLGIQFLTGNIKYQYFYETKEIKRVDASVDVV